MHLGVLLDAAKTLDWVIRGPCQAHTNVSLYKCACGACLPVNARRFPFQIATLNSPVQ